MARVHSAAEGLSRGHGRAGHLGDEGAAAIFLWCR